MKKSAYQRPNKPARKGVYKRERVPDRAPFQAPPLLEVHRSTECHVTPTDVAARMVEYLEPECTDLICEPQAGTGNLIAALLDYGISIKNINAVEKNQELHQLLVRRFPGGLNLLSGVRRLDESKNTLHKGHNKPALQRCEKTHGCRG